MNTFAACQEVNELLLLNRERDAREALIRLLDYHTQERIAYSPVLNHLIRATGLYPYLQPDTADWADRFVSEAFKVNVGLSDPATLHREQSAVLRRLIEGQDLAISAPTSFGKSFIIDAFITIRRPRNVVILVPTIALTDETRRRLQKKFSPYYKVISTAGVELGERNICIFPQERAISYVDAFKEIDLLVVDEFYKASPLHDKERSPALLKAIMKLGRIARQRYFLAPNISTLNESPFTKGMEFLSLDFNTVYLETFNMYEEIGRDAIRKSQALIEILGNSKSKTLIYAGTYSNIERLSNLLTQEIPVVDGGRLADFSAWLAKNYDPNWQLTNLVKRGTGVHNGQLHRSLSQIQIKLFEEQENGLTNLISTSSIIEGVNTSAENVVIWSNRNGAPLLKDFTYKNILGRGGRMFKHFVGKVYVLEAPPKSAETQLELTVPDELLGVLDEDDWGSELTSDQIARIIEYREDMRDLLGEDSYRRLHKSDGLQSTDGRFIRGLTRDIVQNPGEWTGLGALNAPNPMYWDSLLYRIVNLRRGGWDARHSHFVAFIKEVSRNWDLTIPELLDRLDDYDIGIEQFFKLERTMSLKFASLLGDVDLIQREVLGNRAADISPFITRIAHAFLPPLVYHLEEYGLPRMLSKKIQRLGIFDFTDPDITLHQALEKLHELGLSGLMTAVPTFDSFDRYILEHFLDGITPAELSA
jgi:hypothetical protein